ncbi:MAG TPA: hypothetical protein VJ984_14890 [Xanthomonadales bacterium]|nr:hypothetical protein [Xanthomonadales bacterium]
MKSLILIGWATVALAWMFSAQAAELNAETMASFLPSAMSGYTKDSDAIENTRPDEGIWAGARYDGATTFILQIQKSTPAAENMLALVERFSQSERPINIVDINGVGFIMLGGECFTALAGDVVVSCSNFDPDVQAHLETIDFDDLSALAVGARK